MRRWSVEASCNVETLLDDLLIDVHRQQPAQRRCPRYAAVEIVKRWPSVAALYPLDEPLAGGIHACRRNPAHRGLPQGAHIGVLINDHNVRETLGICDHAYIISEGTVLAAGQPKDIIANDAVRKVYLGENFRM